MQPKMHLAPIQETGITGITQHEC